MGWEVNRFAGHAYHSHGGGIFGFPAYVATLPEIDAGVVVLANGSLWTPYYPHQEIVAWVFARLLDLEARDWHAETLEQTRTIEAMAEQGLAAFDGMKAADAAWPLPPAAYAGAYRDVHSAELLLEEADGTVRLRFTEEGAFSALLEPWAGNMAMMFFDGGDGQAWSRAPANFVLEGGETVAAIDLGRMGRYERVR